MRLGVESVSEYERMEKTFQNYTITIICSDVRLENDQSYQKLKYLFEDEYEELVEDFQEFYADNGFEEFFPIKGFEEKHPEKSWFSVSIPLNESDSEFYRSETVEIAETILEDLKDFLDGLETH